MEPAASPYLPPREPGWRRLVLGVVLRSLRTVAGWALAALAVFLVATLVVERSLADGSAIPLATLYVPYVLLGVLAGVNVGLSTALRREAGLLAERSGWVVAPAVERALAGLAVPREGMETARLRELAELRALVPAGGGRLHRRLAAFAVARALEDAGLRALQERLLGLVERAEARGETVIPRELVEAAARDGMAAAVARQLDVGWRASRAVALAAAGVALLTLPALATILG